MRNNHIDNLDLQTGFKKLEYLNVRQNKILSFAEFEKIKQIPSLTILNAKENPCIEEAGEGAKKQILMILYQQL